MRGVVVLALLALSATASAGPDKYEPCALVVVVDRTLDAERLAGVQEGIESGFRSLDRRDQVAVVAFAGTAQVPLRLQSAARAHLTALRTADAGDLAQGLAAAYRMLLKSKAQNRRVLVITDGNSLLGVQPIAAKMRAVDITMSVVGYQTPTSSRARLGAIASAGGGRRYSAARPRQVSSIIESRVESTHEPTASVFLIDRSVSMQGAKLETAKELARASIELLPGDDTVAVVAFDKAPETIVRSSYASNRMRISTEISRIASADGTDLVKALGQARRILDDAKATVEHVVLLSDGAAPSDGVAERAAELHGAGITISVVAIGADEPGRKMLAKLAEIGEGKFYVLDDLGSASSLPRMLFAPIE
ncbi:MAG: VWA domain-containing protein [Kofleriaceae bacterium]|nr:VWA domain-containing protein [Kofleriaceae bacterium]